VSRASKGPGRRYEPGRPDEFVHIDIKRLGRFWIVGKQSLTDDYSRLADVELLPNEGLADCVTFLRRAAAWCTQPRHRDRTRSHR